MNNYEALFEDENDIVSGSPMSKYWGVASKTQADYLQEEFDEIVERIAIMESIIEEHHEIEDFDKAIKNYGVKNRDKIDEVKKSVYMELAGKLIYRATD